jgi:hypothetical protein
MVRLQILFFLLPDFVASCAEHLIRKREVTISILRQSSGCFDWYRHNVLEIHKAHAVLLSTISLPVQMYKISLCPGSYGFCLTTIPKL